MGLGGGSSETDISDSTESFSVSYAVGGGLSYKILPILELFVESRLVNSVSSISKTASENFKHRHVYILLGVGFDL